MTYRDRDILLGKLGYSTYHEYLQSDLWKSIKTRAHSIHGRSCKLCGMYAPILHHTKYDRATLLGRRLDTLVPLCMKCHDRIELKRDGSKRKLVDVVRMFNRLVANVRPKRKT